MAGGTVSFWNLRARHMFDTLLRVLEARGPGAKAVVWAHNSHVGNAAATEMGRRGEHNIGQLCRQHFGEEAVLIGFGTTGAPLWRPRAGGHTPKSNKFGLLWTGATAPCSGRRAKIGFCSTFAGAPTTACDRLLNPSGWSERSASCTCPQPSA